MKKHIPPMERIEGALKKRAALSQKRRVSSASTPASDPIKQMKLNTVELDVTYLVICC
jgi:hypothetical protein